MLETPTEIPRPGAVLAAQVALVAQASFDLLAAVGLSAYYGWAMSLTAQVAGNAWWVPAASGGLSLVGGLVLAAATAAATWALSTRHPAAWVSGIGVCAVHLVLNPCCAVLPMAVIALLAREDVRHWLD
jgi:hypothetical protein